MSSHVASVSIHVNELTMLQLCRLPRIMDVSLQNKRRARSHTCANAAARTITFPAIRVAQHGS